MVYLMENYLKMERSMNNIYKYDSAKSIEKYINSLENYQGYVQYSDSKIRDCDIFYEFQNIVLTPTNGFIYEAHFFNGKDSLTIKQVNSLWIVDKVENVNLTHTKTYSGINNLEIKMSQIWEEKEDSLCLGMLVKKLKKVVFTGFKKKKVKPTVEENIEEESSFETLTQEEKNKLLESFLSIYNDDYIKSMIRKIRNEK